MAAVEVTDTVAGGALSVVSDSQAQVTSDQVLATALPQGTSAGDVQHEGSWSTVTLDYASKWSNGPESKAVVNVAFAHSARYKNGGAFIPQVVAWVDSMEVPDSSKLMVSFEASTPYVVGEEQAPIAALPVTVAVTEAAEADTAEDRQQFVFYGTGYVEVL